MAQPISLFLGKRSFEVLGDIDYNAHNSVKICNIPILD